MIAVDLWRPQNPRNVEGAESYANWAHEDHYRGFSQIVAKHFSDRVDIMRMDTHDASRSVEEASLDFVFIDADHSYEGCKRDIEDWVPKVKSGGMILGHDVNWPTVKKAVDEKYPHYVVFADNVWGVPV